MLDNLSNIANKPLENVTILIQISYEYIHVLIVKWQSSRSLNLYDNCRFTSHVGDCLGPVLVNMLTPDSPAMVFVFFFPIYCLTQVMNRDIRRELEQSTAFTLITLPFNNREWSKTNANIYQVSDYYCRNAGNDMLIDKHVNLFC